MWRYAQIFGDYNGLPPPVSSIELHWTSEIAPPWRFWAGGRASFSGISSGSVERAPRSQVVVPGGRGPEPPGAKRLRAAAAGRHSPLRLRHVSGDGPSESEDI